MTPQLKERLGLTQVPLTIRLGETEYIDGERLNLPLFMEDMRACEKAGGSSSPSPFLYQEQFETNGEVYAVTLSDKLSGSYASAMLGKMMAEENGADNIHIIDSKSASAGEVLVALKIRELLDKGERGENLVAKMKSFIDAMKTYFVLERYDNLLKNGRLNRITERLITLLNIKLLMGADGNGEIALFAKARGMRQMLDKMLEMIERSGKNTQDETLVISHCENLELADKLTGKIKERFAFNEIVVVPTGGLSSFYVEKKGIVMAF
jgi:DegV family protein with EDD domain